ncbi:hypothetical protein HDU96_008974 [Phlyctochytrium bullatum]|nr:hypothetical protein HDU96_008974 [Phlyctochytrium bullatum]
MSVKEKTAKPARAPKPVPKHPWDIDLTRQQRIRKIWNLFRASLAVLLSFGFVFYDQVNNKIQSRTWTNVVLSVLVQTPSQTIGAFLDSALISSLGLGLAGGCWAFMNVVAGDNYVAMGVILFVMVYFFSILRAQGQRFFGLGLIGPLLAYTSVASVVGVLGKSTSDGRPFDESYLRDTLYSFLIGFGISVVLTLIGPEFAEGHLRVQILQVTDTLRLLVQETFRSFTTGESSVEARQVHLAKVKEQLRDLYARLEQVNAELYYAKLSAPEYHRIVSILAAVVNHLSAVDGAMAGQETAVFKGALFRERVAVPFASQLAAMERECLDLLFTVAASMHDLSKTAFAAEHERHDFAGLDAAVARFREATRAIDATQQEWLIELVVNGDASGGHGNIENGLAKGTRAQETLIQVSFFMHGMAQIVEKLAGAAKMLVDPAKKKGFHYNGIEALFGPVVASLKKKQKRNWSLTVSRFLMSRNSIYAIKCACAVLCYQLILFTQPNWYRNWFLQTSFLTYVIAVAPSIGQTNLTFVINLFGAAIGYTWAFFALEAFGVGINPRGLCWGWWSSCNGGTVHPEWGLMLMTLFWTVPLVYIQLYSKLGVLGLLALLGYSTSVIGSYANRINPVYDGPWHRYYKLLASASMAISFAFVFTMLVYPNTARTNLRQRISSILRRLNALYNDTLVAAFIPFTSSKDTPEARLAALERAQRQIALECDSLGELLVFSAVEFNAEGKFHGKNYAKMIGRMRIVLDRLTTASTTLVDSDAKPEGEKKVPGAKYLVPLDPAAHKMASKELNAARRDAQNTVRLLLYVYSASMVAKQPLPFALPSATRTRNRVFYELWYKMKDLAHNPVALLQDEDSAGAPPVDAPAPIPDAAHLPASARAFDGFRDAMDEAAKARHPYPPLTHAVAPDAFDLSNPKLPTTAAALERARELMSHSSWLRFYAFANTMSAVALEVDAMAEDLKFLFGELPDVVDMDFLLEAAEAGDAHAPLLTHHNGATSPSSASATTASVTSKPRAIKRNDTLATVGGRRGQEENLMMYGLEDQDDIEVAEGIPMEAPRVPSSEVGLVAEELDLQAVVVSDEVKKA